MQKSASGSRRDRRSSDGSAVAALFGAVATVVVLAGVVGIAASPRSLADDSRLPVTTEWFEVAPGGPYEMPTETGAGVSASGPQEVPELHVNYETSG